MPPAFKIKIIAVSGLAEAGLNERTRAAGVDAFYRKPVEMPLLLTKIDNLLSDLNNEEEPVVNERPQKAELVSRLVTAPLGYTPPPASEEAKEAAAKTAAPQPPPAHPILPPDRQTETCPSHSPEGVPVCVILRRSSIDLKQLIDC